MAKRTAATVAKGERRRGGMWVRAHVELDDETFAEVRAGAIREGVSLGARIRELVEWGLETERETER